MQNIIQELLKNYVLIITLFSWFLVQLIKVILAALKEKRFDFRWFIGTGGMPSSHSAGVSALATCVGLEYGFASVLFAIAITFAAVVIFDAQGVRRATGKQAYILNRILEDIYWKGKIQEKSLKELIGHTPLEVILGAIIGILLAIIMFPKGA